MSQSALLAGRLSRDKTRKLLHQHDKYSQLGIYLKLESWDCIQLRRGRVCYYLSSR